jgi:MFS transporter, YNFM family, putative membrane transport protein
MNSKTLKEAYIPWIIFFSTTFVVATVYMTQSIVSVLAGSFDTSVSNMSSAMAISSLTYALSFIFYGAMSDKFGRKPFMIFGLVGLSVVCIILALVSTYPLFILLCALLGIIAGSVPAVAIPFMAEIMPKEKLGQAMGIALSGTISGTVFGRTIPGILESLIGWRLTYIVFSCLMLLCLIYISRLSAHVKPNTSLSVAASVLNTFKLLKNIKMLCLLLVGVSLFFVYLGSVTFITTYLSEEPFQLSSSNLGLLNLAGIAGIVTSLISGNIVSRWGSHKTLFTGMLITLLSILIMSIFSNVSGFVFSIVFIYMGVFVCQPAIFTMISLLAGEQRKGAASSLYLLACMGGGSLGIYTLQPIYQNGNWNNVSMVCIFVLMFSIILSITYIVSISFGKSKNDYQTNKEEVQ